MKTKYAYCICNKRGNIAIFEAQLPIYFNKKVAKGVLDYWNQGGEKYKMIRVSITSI